MESKVTARTRRAGAVEGHLSRRRAGAEVSKRRSVPSEDCSSTPTSLESRLMVAWAALSAGHPIECPLCSGTMTAAKGCSSCGSRLT